MPIPTGRIGALGAALGVFALAACGGGDSGDKPGASALGDVRVGSVAQLAECRDWNAGTREERIATLAEIKEQINLENGTGETPELSDEAAYELFENTCSEDYADAFRLYKVYARATGFASFAE